MSNITNISSNISRFGDLVLAALVVAIVGLLIIPLPTPVVDLLIAINIGISTVMLMLSLYLPRALAFSTFPSMLLFTTLFRLALNVTTTRLILLKANAGEIINIFGKFVVGGNFVVGAVIFLIITIVQFVVIAKGSERVSEVAARFTLDAMPGKQMSIDADMRAGAIDIEQARQRRAELSAESQLFGAMDGAMKFVKGDSIAGLIITAINIIGGFCIGMLMKGMPAGKAIQTYAILTVGDGLVSQIPALLVSITSGVIVTRVGAEDSKPLGVDIINQFFAQPKSIMLGAVMLVCIGLIPGFPKLQFFCLAALVGLVAYSLMIMQKRKAAAAEQAQEDPLQTKAAVSSVDTEHPKPKQQQKEGDDFSLVVPLMVDIDANVRKALTYNELNEEIMSVRRALYHDLGVPFPGINLRLNENLTDGRYRIMVHEVPVSEGQLRLGKVFVTEQAENLEVMGVPCETDKAFLPGFDTIWTDEDKVPALEQAGVGFMKLDRVLTYHLSHVLRKYAGEFISLQETKLLLDHLEKTCPEIVREVMRVLPLQKLTDVLQRLVSEGISVRDLKCIMQCLIEWGQKEKDTVLLVEYARSSLSRYISYKYSGGQNLLAAYLLDPALEEKIRKAIRQTSGGSYLALDPSQVRKLMESIKNTVGDMRKLKLKPVMLVSVDIRRYLRKIIESEYAELPVLSYQELSKEINIQPLGRIS
ncbi:MAG: type III secretion system export apparatus subunit SctV [Victivallales bacterium]|nr:type III secretion system export apparatus subunit SctV [Victivallales bacterium]